MSAQILPLYEAYGYQVKNDWRETYFGKVNKILDQMEDKSAMGGKLWDITGAILEHKSQILGDMALGLIESRYPDLLQQEYLTCPGCGKQLKRRGMHKREVETLPGKICLERPYFYCVGCSQGFYPLDESLGLSSSPKQYDIQDVEAWLSSELPFEVAAETYKRCTGGTLSAHNMHQHTNKIAESLDILDICPTRKEIVDTVSEVRGDQFRRPVMMLAIDGAHTPTRPEPSPRSGKRGKGEWKEAKGFRLYLIDGERIVHLISWHQVGSDQDLTRDLEKVKAAGLIPEDKARLCIIGDGAGWIWNRMRELFPKAREVLDFYHCSQHLHAAAEIRYGKGTRQAQEWVEATLTRLFLNQIRHVIAGLKRMSAVSADAQKKIDSLIGYLSRHKGRVNYGAAKRGGYHIGSGAIESSNKFIGHVRLKRSGAWWYPTNANNILKLRCAKYNGTYDRVIELYKKRDQLRLQENKVVRLGDKLG